MLTHIIYINKGFWGCSTIFKSIKKSWGQQVWKWISSPTSHRAQGYLLQHSWESPSIHSSVFFWNGKLASLPVALFHILTRNLHFYNLHPLVSLLASSVMQNNVFQILLSIWRQPSGLPTIFSPCLLTWLMNPSSPHSKLFVPIPVFHCPKGLSLYYFQG